MTLSRFTVRSLIYLNSLPHRVQYWLNLFISNIYLLFPISVIDKITVSPLFLLLFKFGFGAHIENEFTLSFLIDILFFSYHIWVYFCASIKAKKNILRKRKKNSYTLVFLIHNDSNMDANILNKVTSKTKELQKYNTMESNCIYLLECKFVLTYEVCKIDNMNTMKDKPIENLNRGRKRIWNNLLTCYKHFQQSI